MYSLYSYLSNRSKQCILTFLNFTTASAPAFPTFFFTVLDEDDFNGSDQEESSSSSEEEDG